MQLRTSIMALAALVACAAPAVAQKFDYRLLATMKTSTMEKELNQAGAAGYRFGGAMGGESAAGGKEVIVVMMKNPAEPTIKQRYRLLATLKTGTLQNELQQAGDEGFEYCGQTVFEAAFGGHEVVVILGRSEDSTAGRIQYKLLATKLTSTMEKELREAGDAGFKFLSVVIGKTAFGGKEVVSILQRTEK